MVEFSILPCDVLPHLSVTCSRYELHVEIVYPLSFFDQRTPIQKIIESQIGFRESFPVINIWPLQFYLGIGNRVRSFSLYFGRTKEEEFKYEGGFENYPTALLGMKNIDVTTLDLYFHDQVSVKIDREKHVIRIDIGERRNTYQTFSLADDLIVNVDKDNNLVSIVFRNFRRTDGEEALSVKRQNTVTIRSFFGTLFKRVRKLLWGAAPDIPSFG
jgi:hypothetical protein